MKRSKIMLTAIGVLAVVGGALAFKANHVGTNKYCYTFTNACGNAVNTCPKGLITTFLPCGTISSIKYTLTTNTTRCSITPPTCYQVGRFTTEF
jgi:hypothetical protein